VIFLENLYITVRITSYFFEEDGGRARMKSMPRVWYGIDGVEMGYKEPYSICRRV